ncbi:hypothetical protein VSS74_01655 [Conexibacter stalactiti]|uniref:Macroglobulin domain-containing protein n=1 Tax=Conexibacter stalactiti TaxID=1940611 RepID=A0ABU4HJZ4_9ACTN|nr:hypothetical protein [Conexibacter stalactiti]MDW5593024.1 hypothetical protein [Conexibacter stalactiti]MEC5033665.1 hypothetical protein [Conexibacter stalactiti]
MNGAINYVDLGGLNTPRMYFMAWCVRETADGRCETGLGGALGRVEIAAAAVRLGDDHAPTVQRATGTLASGSPVSGRLEAAFDAADVGGGVYRAIVEVKINQSGGWRELAAPILDRLDGRCAPAGETSDAYEFLHPVPCPRVVADKRVAIDTSQLPAGDHLVRARVEDVAGNRTDIVPPRIVHIAEPDRGRPLGTTVVEPPASRPNNGAGASAKALVRLRADEKTVSYRKRLDVRGRLVDENDRAIAGATLQVDTRRLVPRRGAKGAAWKSLGKVATDRAGRFTARVPTTTSRTLRFSYKASVEQEGFTSAAEFNLQVRAFVTVRAVRDRVRNGRAAVFVGRVAGTPRGGVPLSLQAWVTRRGWTPARTEQKDPRTGRNGRFKVSYRFARTFDPVVYRFRVVVGEDSSFPFVGTASRRLKVVVRP